MSLTTIPNESFIAIIGLGYVGLPLATAFAQHGQVIGFDTDEHRIEKLKKGEDQNQQLSQSLLSQSSLLYTHRESDLKKASTFIITVPTPIDEHKNPNLKQLIAATTAIAGVIKKGDLVVFESTVYPGCTDEVCVPILEEISNLVAHKDFEVGYSPERINVGDDVHTLQNTNKVVSAGTEKGLARVTKLYAQVVEANLHPVSSIRVAEAAKIIENTQRDLNIALMNELSIVFSRMGINTYEVLDAAETKWNFLPFKPGLVGGHCIGVDPYYLTYKAKELGYHPQVIQSGRFVNDSMGFYTAKQTVKQLARSGKNLNSSKVHIMGATFKENVKDIRNSKSLDIYTELKSYGVDVDISDPNADEKQFFELYGIKLSNVNNQKYDAIIVATQHREYLNLTEEDFLKNLNSPGILIDVKGIYRGKMKQLTYWSL